MNSPARTDLQLSPHFWLSEFTHSETAARLGLRNEADGVQIANLKRVAMHGEEVRSLLGNVPMTITSGLRTLVVNGLVKKIITPAQLRVLDQRPDLLEKLRNDPSVHKFGRGMDFICPAYGSPRDICMRIAESSLRFDQLIFEGTWVHYGIAAEGAGPRREVLTAVFRPGQRVQYLPGVV